MPQGRVVKQPFARSGPPRHAPSNRNQAICLAGEKIGVQEVVSEFPFRIVLRCQLDEIGQLFIPGPQRGGRYGKQLAPMRASVERGKLFLDNRQQAPYGGAGPLSLEMGCGGWVAGGGGPSPNIPPG